MCMNAGQPQTPSGMRPAVTTSGMHCQGVVGGTQAQRQPQAEPPRAKLPLLCVANYQLR